MQCDILQTYGSHLYPVRRVLSIFDRTPLSGVIKLVSIFGGPYGSISKNKHQCVVFPETRYNF